MNGVQRILGDDVGVGLGQKKPTDDAIAAGHSVESYSYSKIARWALHQACEDQSHTSTLNRHGVTADAWQD